MPENKKYALLALALFVVPLLIYAFMRVFSYQVFKPVLRMYEVGVQGDTTYYGLPKFHFTDAEGKPFTDEEAKGNVYVFQFFSPAPDSFQRVVTNVAQGNLKDDFYENILDADFIKIVSIATEPVAPEQLRAFPEQLKVKPEKWKFVSGSKSEVWKLAKDAFRLPEFQGKDSTSSPFPMPNVVITDEAGRVLGYYDKYDNVNKGYYDASQKGINGTRTMNEDIRALLTSEYEFSRGKRIWKGKR